MTFKERRQNFARWRMNIRRLIRYEDQFFARLKKLFGKQEKEVLKNLEKAKYELPEKPKKADDDKIINQVLFNEKEWIKNFSDDVKPLIGSIVAEAGKRTIDSVGFALDFNKDNKSVIEFIDSMTFRFAKDVNKNTIEKLTPSLREALKDGENIEKIRKRIQAIFDGGVRGEANRARLIARTETLAADNGGSLLGAEQVQRDIGVETRKGWLTSRDAKVRETHIKAGKQYGTKLKSIPLHKKFRVGKYWMKHPGDMAGGVEERARCRCALIFFVTRKRIKR